MDWKADIKSILGASIDRTAVVTANHSNSSI